MIFSSAEFIFLFLPGTLLLYYSPLFRGRRARNVLLVLVSLLFYAWGEPVRVLLLLGSIVFNWLLGRWAEPGRRHPRAALAAAAVGNLAVLFVFKYLGFLCENLGLLGLPVPEVDISLPVGISFYTFQALSYVIDVYRGRSPAQKNILDVGLYIAFFPQLIAGPIVRYETVAREIHHRRECWADFSGGVPRFIAGLGKKAILANTLAIAADAAFRSESLSAPMAWLGAVSYALQIYFDFSGYSDMAIGMGRMFGFHFLENFDKPYRASSVTDFWRRWHISLSSFFRDYVYIPLGGKYRHQLRNICVVWLLTGLWHGASWNFVLWGAWYGALLILEKTVLLRWLERLPAFVGWLWSTLAVLVGWSIFYFVDFGRLLQFLPILFGGRLAPDPGLWVTIQNQLFWLLLSLAFCAPILPGLKNLAARYADGEGKQAGVVLLQAVCCLLLVMVSTAYLVGQSYNPFLYFRF